jgi:hypothetical protein
MAGAVKDYHSGPAGMHVHSCVNNYALPQNGTVLVNFGWG